MRNTKIIDFILFFLLTFSFLSAGEISDKVEKSIFSNFGTNVKINFEKLILPENIKQRIENKAKQRFYKNYVYLYKISKDDSLIAIAILDNVIGKIMPITFIVFFDRDGKILKSDIVKYREQYGGAITNKVWNKQFIGKDYRSNFKPGKDIDGISGATISVNSVSKGIAKLTLLYKELYYIK